MVAAAVTSDMAKAGVGILAGCDTMIAGFCVHDELAAMVRGGMTPLAALQTATINPARYFGLQQTAADHRGRTPSRPGAARRESAGRHLERRRIRAVVVAGRFLERKELDTLLAQVRDAARRR